LREREREREREEKEDNKKCKRIEMRVAILLRVVLRFDLC
jgi:hypothetical protein